MVVRQMSGSRVRALFFHCQHFSGCSVQRMFQSKVIMRYIMNYYPAGNIPEHRQFSRTRKVKAAWPHCAAPGISSSFSNFTGRRKSSCRTAPLLTARPCRALIDDSIVLEGRHLPPNSPVTMRASMHSEEGDLWEALSHYHTDANGTVNLTKDISVGGSYSGCEPMGLFWSLQPGPGVTDGLRLRKKDVGTPYTVDVSVLEGHVSRGDARGGQGRGGAQELATVRVERSYMAPGVRRIEIRQNQVVGTLFLPSGPGPFPGVLDLWGMGGGLIEYRSALFASHGFASLALAYIGHKDIPGSPKSINVRDPYFKSAFQILQDHPQVCGDRISVMGLSFGVYFALRIATHLSLDPKCVIAINGPFGSFNKMLNEDGEREAFDENQKHWSIDEKGYVSFREVSVPSNIPPENFVKIENLQCPLLYIIGGDDLSCAAIENADEIERRLKTAGKSHLLTRLSYPGTGHLIDPPHSPHSRASLWTTRPTKLVTLWGGNPTEHAAAQEDSWRKILAFLDSHLRREK